MSSSRVPLRAGIVGDGQIRGETVAVTVFNDRGCIEVVGRLRVPILIYGPSGGPPTRAV